MSDHRHQKMPEVLRTRLNTFLEQNDSEKRIDKLISIIDCLSPFQSNPNVELAE
eukprot:Pgem_evm1s12094